MSDKKPGDEPPRAEPPPKPASDGETHEVYCEQVRHTEETIHYQVANGGRVPVRVPPPLSISGRVLVAAFLLPYEATIDLEQGREWVGTVYSQELTSRIYNQDEATPPFILPYGILAKIPIGIQN